MGIPFSNLSYIWLLDGNLNGGNWVYIGYSKEQKAWNANLYNDV